MADKDTKAQELTGSFRLGRKFDEVGPDVGRLYESWHLPTGRPAVTLRPDHLIIWLHRGPWRFSLSCEHGSPDVSLTLEEAPPFAPPTEVGDLLVLMSTAFQRMEDSPRLHAHFASGPVKTPRTGWTPRALASAAVLTLGLGLWSYFKADVPPAEDPCPAMDVDAPSLINFEDPSGVAIAYPLPKKPFRNQARAPCKHLPTEVEFNGGCWVALEQKPPCSEDRAEHEGKCYLPVSKDRGTLPQSSEP